ncbi:hypothetical protein FB45DRAFT_542579 [Roridomyces roridus]|uniref:Uncharacterized protein n=1 Tax=Roridomyces roridus TaxID=1738132 RepID=A0AAD7BTW4_9AGAR|nr:hypothetical protein FB45DRAFT_542579 [Roridomyces roridus]
MSTMFSMPHVVVLPILALPSTQPNQRNFLLFHARTQVEDTAYFSVRTLQLFVYNYSLFAFVPLLSLTCSISFAFRLPCCIAFMYLKAARAG